MAEDDYALGDDLPDDDRDYETEYPEHFADDFGYKEEWGDLPDDWYDWLGEGDYEVYDIDVSIAYGDDT